MASPDFSNIVTALGEYSRAQGPALVMGMFDEEALGDFQTVIDNEGQSEYPLPMMEFGSFTRPWAATTDAVSGAVDFVARKALVRQCKGDLDFIPQAQYKTYLQTLWRKRLTPSELPFEAMIMDGMFRKAAADAQIKAVWKGVYNASGTTPAAQFDGFETILDADLASGYVREITGGAGITDANIVDVVHDTYELLSEEEKLRAVCYMHPSKRRQYVAAQRALGNTMTGEELSKPGEKVWYLLDTNVRIVDRIGMSTDRVIMSDPENMLVVGNTTFNASNLTIIQPSRKVELLLDYELCVQVYEVGNGRIAMAKPAA